MNEENKVVNIQPVELTDEALTEVAGGRIALGWKNCPNCDQGYRKESVCPKCGYKLK